MDLRPDLPLDPDRQDPSAPSRPVHFQADLLALVAIGGFLGALTRYAVGQWQPTESGRFPAGTFAVNLVGAFILGALIEGLSRSGPDDGWRRRARLLVGTGFCGALTTYSTLAVEADLLVRDHRTGLAAAYLLISLVAGLAATLAGILCATAHHRWRSGEARPS